MNLNLPILSLEVIDSISYQKCLVPKNKFPRNARPGQWAKCYFSELSSEKQYYTVAQVFPRNDIDKICYLDMSVTNYNSKKIRQLFLAKLIFLNLKTKVEKVDVIVKLNAEYFIQNSNIFNTFFLCEMAKILLQKYHIVHDSFIRDLHLLHNGIDSIHVEFQNSDDSIFITTDDTHVDIKNISLTQKEFGTDLISLNVMPFARARQELENLLKLLRWQRALQKRLLYINFNAILIGPIGCGKTTLVHEFLQSHQCNVFYINATNCLKPYPGETEAELRKIFKAASDFEKNIKANDPTILLLEEIHLLSPLFTSTCAKNPEAMTNYMRISTQLLSLVDALFTSRSNIMCLATTSKPDHLNELLRRPGRFENEIIITSLQENQRANILKNLLNKSTLTLNISPSILETIVKHTQGYILADLALLVRNINQVVSTKLKENLENLILDVLTKSEPISLKETDIPAYKTTETFKSIGGMTQLKKVLQASVLAGLKKQESFKRFGLSLPKGVLLYGPPGCGKTSIAKCLATEANMTFISISGAEVYSPYVGCAEKFIAKVFQTARKNIPCLIFLDEIDTLIGRRSLTSSSSSSDFQTRILSTLLTEMDGIITSADQSSYIMVVAATNRPDMVDDALMRPGRFDKLIHVPPPDFLSRRSLLDLYKYKMPFTKSLDIDSIVARTESYSGADICNLCNEAALQAFQRDSNCKEIIMEDFENILKTSKTSLTKSQIEFYYEFESKFS